MISGLMLAARLKALGVPTLLIEKSPIIGEIWRNRYEYLSLHFPHWADHFPYFPYPEHWPTYTPAQKLGLFMEWYVSALELPIWTSSQVVKASVSEDGEWVVEVRKEEETRILKPKHVVGLHRERITRVFAECALRLLRLLCAVYQRLLSFQE